jgi:hypothetical protein
MLISILILIFCLYISRCIFSQIFILALLTLNVLFGVFDFELFYSPFGMYVLVSNFLLMLTLVTSQRHKHSSKFYNYPKSKCKNLLSWILPISIMSAIFIVGINASWLEIREFNNSHPLLWSLFLGIFFCIAALIPQKSWTFKEGFLRAIKSAPLFILVLAIKIKLFIIPIIYIVGVHGRKEKMSISLIIMGIFFSIFLYFIVMTARWLGSNEINLLNIVTTFQVVIDAGFEREMKHQAIVVFNQFYDLGNFLGPEVLQRILLKPFEIFFGTLSLFENPIYYYNEIVYGFSDGYSSHPGIYSDSFAQYSFFGIFYPSLIFIILKSISRRLSTDFISSLLSIGLILFIILMVRGSSYYAIYYLLFVFIICAPVIFFRGIEKYAYHKK